MAEPLLAAGSALVVFFILHFAVWRLEWARDRSVVLIAVLSVLSYLLVVAVMDADISSHIWVSCPLFSLSMMLYLQFYMGIDRSVSIRMMGEVLRAPGGELSLSELEALYSQEYMVKSRLDLLVDRNYLVEDNGVYSCMPKGRYLAGAAVLTRRIYGLRIAE